MWHRFGFSHLPLPCRSIGYVSTGFAHMETEMLDSSVYFNGSALKLCLPMTHLDGLSVSFIFHHLLKSLLVKGEQRKCGSVVINNIIATFINDILMLSFSNMQPSSMG